MGDCPFVISEKTITMRKILFPTDFSPASDNALEFALKLAEKLNATVDLMNVYHLPVADASSVPPEYIEKMLEDKKKLVEAKLESFVHGCNALHIGELKAVYGIFIYHEIADLARFGEYDLILMGTKGEHNPMDRLLGTVTTHTMLQAPCPVMAIPREASFRKIQHIAYATDFKITDEHAVGQDRDVHLLVRALQPHGQAGRPVHDAADLPVRLHRRQREALVDALGRDAEVFGRALPDGRDRRARRLVEVPGDGDRAQDVRDPGHARRPPHRLRVGRVDQEPVRDRRDDAFPDDALQVLPQNAQKTAPIAPLEGDLVVMDREQRHEHANLADAPPFGPRLTPRSGGPTFGPLCSRISWSLASS